MFLTGGVWSKYVPSEGRTWEGVKLQGSHVMLFRMLTHATSVSSLRVRKLSTWKYEKCIFCIITGIRNSFRTQLISTLPRNHFAYEDTYFQTGSKAGYRLILVHNSELRRSWTVKLIPHESTGPCGSLDTNIIEIGRRSSENGPFEFWNYLFSMVFNAFPYSIYNRISIENQWEEVSIFQWTELRQPF